MKRCAFLLSIAFLLAGCAERDRQNSTTCGLIYTAGAGRILDHLATFTSVLDSAPPGLLTPGELPTRFFGQPASSSTTSANEDGFLILEYHGTGFPPSVADGFGLILVDDSSEVVRGVTIFERDPPAGYPTIGSVRKGDQLVPLYALRIRWSAVNDDGCPLFLPLDELTPAAE